MTWTPDKDALRGKVAVVAGATRGAGRGIAMALGEAGATVVCTGRSSTGRTLKSDYDRPETIEETAELVGRAVAALAADSERSRWQQRSVSSADLARAYGFTDVDGTQPDAWADI